MKTLPRLLCLTVLAVPVFAGLSPFPAGIEILPGVAWGPVLHVLMVLGGVAGVCGRAFLANVVAVTALVLSSVVFAGGLVSWLLAMAGGNSAGVAGSIHGTHYVGLALNMLSVIPLALAIVAAIPFDRLEQRLLRGTRGISSGEKYLLMFVRVFNHIVYVVIPNILEVMREEALLRAVSERASRPAGRRSARRWPSSARSSPRSRSPWRCSTAAGRRGSTRDIPSTMTLRRGRRRRWLQLSVGTPPPPHAACRLGRTMGHRRLSGARTPPSP